VLSWVRTLFPAKLKSVRNWSEPPH